MTFRFLKHLLLLLFIGLTTFQAIGQSTAHNWTEELLQSIREDLARPTVHARNLWHTSAAMYDAWAIMDDEAEPYLIGKTVHGFTSPFVGFIPNASYTKEQAAEVAIDYAAYRIIRARFRFSTNAFLTNFRVDNYMTSKGYNIFNNSVNYTTGDPIALGNYIAQQYLAYGLQDGSRESSFYNNAYYTPNNPPIAPFDYGNPNIIDPNSWQPITLPVAFDQGGNPVNGTQNFLGPEWGNVQPFALTDSVIYQRDGDNYKVYIDPGPPPLIDTIGGAGRSDEYKWGFALVSMWSSHCDPSDGVMWDISPGAQGNIDELPTTFEGYQEFYNQLEGGDPGLGHDLNPATGQPYEPNMVLRGDYVRALAEFWADGPESETPPGHWFTIVNYVNEHPELIKQFGGSGEILDDLEWDVKIYFMLSGALHDAAINTWGLKGFYDYLRPISAIRFMAEKGQSSDPALPNYHVAGMPLVPGYIELIEAGDPLAGVNGEFINEIKLYAWRGPEFINNPNVDQAGVGWIRAGEWWPYQRPTFVSPNFAGYLSGHSTFSRSAAEILTAFTGDEFFPGGMGVFEVEMNEFLVFEEGPSQSFDLQWATYRDASDQTSLSRIWGGIHPPADDIPGRIIGIEIAEKVFDKARNLFYNDSDGDGFYSYQDCDDSNPMINPGLPETCDGLDNDCNGFNDDGLPSNIYYADIDGDGFGDSASELDTCLTAPPAGYADNAFDCNDQAMMINPMASESCDNIDNDCDGILNNGLTLFTYFADSDGDGFGNAMVAIDTCLNVPPVGFVIDATDCNDNASNINTNSIELCDAIDNNCDGVYNEGLTLYTYYQDFDDDSFGDLESTIDTCIMTPPAGFVANSLDCDDMNAGINPNQEDIADNGIDEDCSGYDLYLETKIFANPVIQNLRIHFDTSSEVNVSLFDATGRLIKNTATTFGNNFIEVDMDFLHPGIYWVRITQGDEVLLEEKVFKS